MKTVFTAAWLLISLASSAQQDVAHRHALGDSIVANSRFKAAQFEFIVQQHLIFCENTGNEKGLLPSSYPYEMVYQVTDTGLVALLDPKTYACGQAVGCDPDRAMYPCEMSVKNISVYEAEVVRNWYYRGPDRLEKTIELIIVMDTKASNRKHDERIFVLIDGVFRPKSTALVFEKVF